MTTDLHTLVADADPIRDLSLPEPHSVEGERLWADITTGRVRPVRRAGPLRHPVPVLAAVAAAVAVAVLVVQLGPGIGGQPVSSAAAELQQIAANATNQPTPSLGSGQWLSTELNLEYTAQISDVGSTPAPDAQATVVASVKVWSNDAGQACTSGTYGPAQFASPANRAAWQAAGLRDAPVSQPVVSCALSLGSSQSPSLAGGAGVIDASMLPTDPSTLLHELETGTTGIPEVDQLGSSASALSPAFERAEAILVGPTTGVTPAINAALLKAIAMIPGIKMLGQTTTHSGTTGIGFSGPTELGQGIIVLDPTTGALLEARNILDTALELAKPDYVTLKGPIFTKGATDKVTISWVDPVGTPSVVGSSALPAGAQPATDCGGDVAAQPPATCPTGGIGATETP
jgi:hypothetical protein